MVIDFMLSELKRKGMKLTPQRIEIIGILHESLGSHPSLNELHDLLKRSMPTVSFSTLYNTLSTLEKAGLVRLFDHGGETRIEMNLGNHLNIIDTDTGKIMDVDNEQLVNDIAGKLPREKIEGKKVLINVLLYE
jgi:Fur family peroxide stress response transcriptional regulator